MFLECQSTVPVSYHEVSTILQMYTSPSRLFLARVSLRFCDLFWFWSPRLCQCPTPTVPKTLFVRLGAFLLPWEGPRCYSYNHWHTGKEFNCIIGRYIQLIFSFLPLHHHTLSYPLITAILYSEKRLLNIHVSGLDTSSTDLPTHTIKYSRSLIFSVLSPLYSII